MTAKLAGVKPSSKLRSATARELAAYRTDVERLFNEAMRDFAANMQPQADAINADLDDHLARSGAPRDPAQVADATGLRQTWEGAIYEYFRVLNRSAKSLDLSHVNPEYFLPENGFPTDVQ